MGNISEEVSLYFPPNISLCDELLKNESVSIVAMHTSTHLIILFSLLQKVELEAFFARFQLPVQKPLWAFRSV